MMETSVGIDLGTTFSAVAYVDPKTGLPVIIPNREGENITPSVIQFIDGLFVFGQEAESAFYAGELGCAATFKRGMGKLDPHCYMEGKPWTSEELSALLLRRLKEDAEAWLKGPIKDAVITVPAYFDSPEREATIRAAEAAGIKVKQLIDEPNAAALAYGMNNWRENANILVYDLGGGTFDATLVRMIGNGQLATIATRGNRELGGRDWDNRLKQLLLDKYVSETGVDVNSDVEIELTFYVMSEGVKKRLSALQSLKERVSIPSFPKAEITVTREEFEENTADLIRKTCALCEAVLTEAGLCADDITDVLLVGGSTRMPMVSQYLQNMFGKKPIAHVNPDEAVALGAAIQSTKEVEKPVSLMVKELKDGRKVTDHSDLGLDAHLRVGEIHKLSSIDLLALIETTAHAMGVIAVSPDGTRYINEIIIPANHPRPVRIARAFAFYTDTRDSNEMEIYVIQGDREKPLENLVPHRYVVTGIRHIAGPKGTKIRVQYSYDKNGIIKVQARQENDTVDLPIRKEPVPDDMSKFDRPLEKRHSPEPLNVVLAVDVSGSMSGTPLNDAKVAMCEFISGFDFTYTKVAVIAVSDSTAVIMPLTADASACKRAIQSIQCGQTGGSNEAHPFYEIIQLLEKKKGRLFAIILADGMWQRQEVAVAAAKECNKAGIKTAAIGFGSADKKFLEDISSESANALYVKQSSELTGAFGTIAQSLDGGAANAGQDTLLTSSPIADTWD